MRSDGLRIDGPTALHVPRVSATDDPGEVGVVDVVMLCVEPALDAALGMRWRWGQDCRWPRCWAARRAHCRPTTRAVSG